MTTLAKTRKTKTRRKQTTIKLKNLKILNYENLPKTSSKQISNRFDKELMNLLMSDLKST
jgi:hypothetical protein